MKLKSLFFVGMLLAFAINMQAQGKGRTKMDANQRAEQQTAKMAEQLDLSDAQTARVKDINAKYAKKIQEVRSATTDRNQMGEKVSALRKAQNEELRAVLTDQQAEKWSLIQEKKEARRTEMSEKRTERIDHKPGHKGGNGRDMSAQKGKKYRSSASGKQDFSKKVAKMKEELNLSDQQVTQIEAIYAKYNEQIVAARAEAKEGDKSDIKALRMAQDKEIKAVLTPEQLAKRKELQAQKKSQYKEKKSKVNIPE